MHENHPTREKATRVRLALLSRRKNGGLLVVYRRLYCGCLLLLFLYCFILFPKGSGKLWNHHCTIEFFCLMRLANTILQPTTDIFKIVSLSFVGKTIAGTTDSPTELSPNPAPKEAEIQFILSEIKHYLTEDLEGKSPKPVSSFSKMCLTGSLPPV